LYDFDAAYSGARTNLYRDFPLFAARGVFKFLRVTGNVVSKFAPHLPFASQSIATI
jgi:hypothetical protein